MIKKVVIIGRGLMGSQILDYLNTHNFQTLNLGREDDLNLIKGYDLIIETITEDLRAKQVLLRKISKITDSLITTNTSSLDINLLAKSVNNPKRFAGLHFFNPVSKMQLVEILRHNKISENTLTQLKLFVSYIEKKSVIADKSIVNHLLFPMLNNACNMLKSATKEDIDDAMKMGLNLPIGIFKLIDLIGVDTTYSIIKNLKLRPSPILEEMILQNNLGRKTKKGFYEYK